MILNIYKMAPSRPFQVNPFRNSNQAKTFSPLIQVSKKTSHLADFNLTLFFQINITSRVVKRTCNSIRGFVRPLVRPLVRLFISLFIFGITLKYII